MVHKVPTVNAAPFTNVTSVEKNIGTLLLDRVGEIKILMNEFSARIAFAKYFESGGSNESHRVDEEQYLYTDIDDTTAIFKRYEVNHVYRNNNAENGKLQADFDIILRNQQVQQCVALHESLSICNIILRNMVAVGARSQICLSSNTITHLLWSLLDLATDNPEGDLNHKQSCKLIFQRSRNRKLVLLYGVCYGRRFA